MKLKGIRLGSALSSLLLLTSCGSSQKSEVPKEKVAEKKAVVKVEEPAPVAPKAVHAKKPDYSDKLKEDKYQKYVKRLAISCMITARKSDQIKGCHTFEVEHKEATRLLKDLRYMTQQEGAYFFRLKNSFGKGDALDQLAIIPTTDPYEVVAAVGTGDTEETVGSQDVIDWLRKLEAEQAFVLTGIGSDFVEGHFTDEVKNSEALAKKMVEICPTVIDEEKEQVADLAKRLGTSKELLLKW